MNEHFIMYKKFGRSFFRFITIYAFDRQTDRQTHISAMANTALHSIVYSAVKNYERTCREFFPKTITLGRLCRYF